MLLSAAMSHPRFHSFHAIVRFALAGCAVALLSASTPAPARAQGYDRIARARAKKMLEVIAEAVEKRYYDQEYRGIDLDAHFRAADQKLDSAESLTHAFRIIAQALLAFDDSHTFFVPPGMGVSVDYGWRMRTIGDDCYVTAVRPGSDAEAKGLRAGDRLLALQGYKPTRADLWKLQYLFHTLSPMRAMDVEAQSPDAAPRRLAIESKITPRRRVTDFTDESGFDLDQLIRDLDDELTAHTFVKVGAAVLWRMPSFNLSESEIDGFLRQHVGADTPLILDLRGNGGGYVSTLEDLVARFFDRDVRIADLKGRKAMKPMVAKKRRARPMAGRLVVLIDSASGSAAELFARVVQLEGRGTVIGDRSSGAVMEAEWFSAELGAERVIPYGASIAIADLLMADGKSLERVGVVPDERLLPSAADLAAGRDPVLARAATVVGATLTPEEAGKLSRIEWK